MAAVMFLCGASAAAKPLMVRVESSGCIDDSALSTAIAKYQRRPIDSADLLLHVVELEPGRAHLEVVEADAVVAERELSPLSGTCQEQTDALALAASIAIDALLHERRERKPLPAPRPASHLRRTEPGGPASPPAQEKPRNWLGAAGFGVGLQAIGLSLRAELGVTWHALPPLLLSCRALTELGREQEVGSGGMTWQRFGGSAGVGVRLVAAHALRLDALLEGVVVMQLVRGQRFESPLAERRAEAGVSTSLRLAPAWRFSPYIEPAITVWAREQRANAVAPNETRAIGRVGFRLLLGVACCGG